MTARFTDHVLAAGNHASLPAAASSPLGALYSCTDHSLVYRNDGTTWQTWADLAAGGVAAGAWATYTPTWTANITNPTLGNGTLVGRYVRQADDTVHFNITLVIGSTTTVGSGAWNFSLPVPAISRSDADATVFIGSAAIIDVSVAGAVAHGYCQPVDATKVSVAYPTSATAVASVTHNTPFAWAAGDIIRMSGTYQAAP